MWLFLLAVGLVRLVSLAAYPLMDTTEARYGEIARLIVESGNWIVPQIDYAVPFWGKPPLSFWASAASIESFSNSEFFLRLPHFLAALLVLLVIWQFARSQGLSRDQANAALAVVATSIGFLVAAGAVMTDMFLCLAMTLAMAGFWRGWHGETGYVYLMYAGLGIGLMAKGPIVIALAALAILPWIALTCGFKRMWLETIRRLRIASGLVLMLLIAAPWYYLMERESPGFFQYFIVGEHFQRFIDSGWRGDLYGSGHAHIRGTIWIYWMLFAFPWSLPIVVSMLGLLRGQRKSDLEDPLLRFLLLWTCSPMLMFTLAGNILPAYVLPGIPAIGMLIVRLFRTELLVRGKLLLLVGPAILLTVVVAIVFDAGARHSEKQLISGIADSGEEIYYYHDRPYSAQYYSDGRAQLTESFPQSRHFYLVTRKDVRISDIRQYCELRQSSEKRRLYFCERDDAV